MATSSHNQQTSAIRGGTGATRTPANTASDPPSKATTGKFSSENPGAPKRPEGDSIFNTQTKIGGTPQTGQGMLGKVMGSIKDTLGTSK
ncbi:hypothetical protein K440DRAFT_63607 [Wilcoxina mikolae CBS 423.85]|nr:hypothetical protein K440DRAFT_63607 [Wilcoxina mikolae CBS 423.85]